MVGGAGLLSGDQKGFWGRERLRNAVLVSMIILGWVSGVLNELQPFWITY